MKLTVTVTNSCFDLHEVKVKKGERQAMFRPQHDGATPTKVL